MVAIDLVERGD